MYSLAENFVKPQEKNLQKTLIYSIYPWLGREIDCHISPIRNTFPPNSNISEIRMHLLKHLLDRHRSAVLNASSIPGHKCSYGQHF